MKASKRWRRAEEAAFLLFLAPIFIRSALACTSLFFLWSLSASQKTLFMPTHTRTCLFISRACVRVYLYFWQSEAKTPYLSLRTGPGFSAAFLPSSSVPCSRHTFSLPQRRNHHHHHHQLLLLLAACVSLLLQSLPSASPLSPFHFPLSHFPQPLPACLLCFCVCVCVCLNHLKCSVGVQILIHHACLLPSNALAVHTTRASR